MIRSVFMLLFLGGGAGVFFWLDAPTTQAAETDGISGRIVVTGSSTIAPLMGEIGKRFEALHPGVRVDVQAGGSARGMTDVRGGLAEIGMVSRELSAAEGDLSPHGIARDGVCLIAHASNPVQELSAEQVVGIYTGRHENWSELGGPDRPLVVIHKAEGRSTLEVFLQHFGLDNREVRADVIIGENQQGIKTLAANKGGIAYVSIGAAQIEIERGVPIRMLDLGGIRPSMESLVRGEFPIQRILNLVTLPEMSARARALVEFTRSPEVHDLVRSQHFVPFQG